MKDYKFNADVAVAVALVFLVLGVFTMFTTCAVQSGEPFHIGFMVWAWMTLLASGLSGWIYREYSE